MIDRKKRNSLRTLGAAGVGTAAAASAPGVMAAVSGVLRSEVHPGEAPFSGITVKHYTNFEGHTLLFQNETGSAITLQRFYEGEVKTPTGNFDLNAVFRDRELIIPANATQAVSISRDGTVNRYALWTSSSQPASTMPLIDRTQEVNVVGQYQQHRFDDSQIYMANIHLA